MFFPQNSSTSKQTTFDGLSQAWQREKRSRVAGANPANPTIKKCNEEMIEHGKHKNKPIISIRCTTGN